MRGLKAFGITGAILLLGWLGLLAIANVTARKVETTERDVGKIVDVKIHEGGFSTKTWAEVRCERLVFGLSAPCPAIPVGETVRLLTANSGEQFVTWDGNPKWICVYQGAR